MTLTLDNLNNFIKSLVTVKSSELRSCLATEKHSSPYSKIGIHLQLILAFAIEESAAEAILIRVCRPSVVRPFVNTYFA